MTMPYLLVSARPVLDVLESQARSALLPDAAISAILDQHNVDITYEPLEYQAVALSLEEMADEHEHEFYYQMKGIICNDEAYQNFVVGDFMARLGMANESEYRIGKFGSGERIENRNRLAALLFASRLLHENHSSGREKAAAGHKVTKRCNACENRPYTYK
ncbi:hypothetical protein KIN20_002893 [Parelaphostrongylus tenuis]|uniref:Uncharacterized protein n=1 Tax=Parelaphostrongylus tenuis TaxID=148309 RepID=A0AAD5M0G9_PARTN|nr:hypothetical protein KIN20_002893 [Parelaphostrongylus tenuis]